MPGLMQLKRVDAKRIEQVNKIRNIATGTQEQDWIVEARKRSAEGGGEQPLPFNPLLDKSPLQRAAEGL